MEWGAINRVVADVDLQQVAEELAVQMANGPTLAYGVVKKLLHSSFANGLETQMGDEARNIAAMAKLDDGKEGISAFMEKRKPEFQGK